MIQALRATRCLCSHLRIRHGIGTACEIPACGCLTFRAEPTPDEQIRVIAETFGDTPRLTAARRRALANALQRSYDSGVRTGYHGFRSTDPKGRR